MQQQDERSFEHLGDRSGMGGTTTTAGWFMVGLFHGHPKTSDENLEDKIGGSTIF